MSGAASLPPQTSAPGRQLFENQMTIQRGFWTGRMCAASLGFILAGGLGTLSGLQRGGAPIPTPASPAPAPASAPAVAPTASVPAPAIAPSVPAAPTGEATQGVAQIQDLLDSLARYDKNGRAPEQKVGFEIPEKAVNEYLAYILHRNPRPGVASALVTLGSRNDVIAVVEMDFDAVQQWSPEIFPEPLRPVLRGRRAVRLNAQFEARNGEITFTVKEARLADGTSLASPVVASLLQALGQHQPEAYDTTKPIRLPFGLKRLWIDKRAVCGET
jgi:hypothetical protein